jgi:hypothetical protein
MAVVLRKMVVLTLERAFYLAASQRQTKNGIFAVTIHNPILDKSKEEGDEP